MKLLSCGRLPRAAVLCMFVCSLPLCAQAAGDPWSKVPPLSTLCYSNGDPFAGKIDAADAAVTAEKEAQLATNNKIREQYANMDPMEQATRMQQWMMSNPQEATAYLQRAADTTKVTADASKDTARRMALDEERRVLINRYKAALKQAHEPSQKRWRVLAAKYNVPEDSWLPEQGVTPADYAEADNIQRMRDTEYQTACATWWSKSGTMQGYLGRYRDWLVREHIPFIASNDDAVRQQYAIMSTPAASWRSLAAHDGVLEYLRLAKGLYTEREAQPRCDSQRCRF